MFCFIKRRKQEMLQCRALNFPNYKTTFFTPGIILSSQVKTKDATVLTTPMNMNLPKAPIHDSHGDRYLGLSGTISDSCRNIW